MSMPRADIVIANLCRPKKLGHNRYAQFGTRKAALVLVLQLIVFAALLMAILFLRPSAPV
ncbi:hypothetical protein C3941_09535 [Kaistia algarum]|nr:hypothetical protein C3941_09535 [Kaistia algarum]